MQYVEWNGQQSERKLILSGVPQGTVLGPLLFTIYIDDLLQQMESRPEATVECFADDAMIYSCGKTLPEAVDQLNTALAHTTEWVKQSNLVLNMDKCVHMILASPWSRKNVEASKETVRLGDHELVRVDCVSYLGVKVDQSLQWDKNFEHVKAKINRGTCLINRAKKGLPKEERLALYHAFVEPHIDFCAPVWSAATDKNLTLVEKAQRNAIRALADYNSEKTTDELFSEL